MLRILICDDFDDARDMLAEMLALKGHHVEIAVDGAGALQRIAGGDLDVAMIDIGLPDMSGYDVARAIRVQGVPIRLIALTGYASGTDHEHAKAAGFDVWFAKPVKIDVLLAALRPI